MNVVYSGAEGFNELFYQPVANSTIDYLRNQLTGFSEILTQSGRQFMDTAKTHWNNWWADYNSNRAAALMQNTQHYFEAERVRHFDNWEELRSASPRNQTYLMALPELAAAAEKQTIFGFNETYVNPYPELKPEDSPIYHAVNNGVVQFTDEGAYYTNWIDSDKTQSLEFIEQTRVLDAWELARIALFQNQDPTDPYQK